MSRKGGGSRVNQERKRVVVVPLWKQEPDLRLFAQAILSLAEQQRASLETEEQAGVTPPKAKEVNGD